MKKPFLAVSAVAAVALAWAAKDPVIMTVNGVDVPLSEFEYLFHKNSRQQLEAQPLDEYVEMFKLYKLKVADALADRLDTLPAFRKEMEQYRAELAAPYMADSTYIYSLVDEYFDWSREEAQAKHIMKFKKMGASNDGSRASLDSIRQAVAAGASWSELAARYSDDKGSADKGGLMSYITVGKFPYAFEKEVFTLPEGKISEVVETPNTMHIIMGAKHRPARGKVLASHILKMVPQSASPEMQAKAKQEIDSLYAVVKANPGQFGMVARENSDDKASARQDGRLSWFSAGEMIPEFDEAAFALADGEISEPVRTQFGWHIIMRHQSAPAPDRDEIKSLVFNRIHNAQDPRFNMVMERQTNNLLARHNGQVLEAPFAEMTAYIEKNGLDSLFYVRFADGPEADVTLMTLGKKPVRKITRRDFFSGMNRMVIPNPQAALSQFDRFRMWTINRKAADAEMERLAAEEPDYRNLLNEYRDGSLLYEASVRKVWDKAARDTEGLKAYFNAHRADYKWDRPHAKGWLVQAADDSIASAAKELMATLPVDSMVYKVRKAFPGKIQIDRVSVPKGANAMVDYLVFDGPEAQPKSSRYTVMFMYEPRVVDQPEEVDDVRGQVTTDYQNLLSEQWTEELKRKYPVKVNQKVLKKVK